MYQVAAHRSISTAWTSVVSSKIVDTRFTRSSVKPALSRADLSFESTRDVLKASVQAWVQVHNKPRCQPRTVSLTGSGLTDDMAVIVGTTH